jgi:hypothetical protein
MFYERRFDASSPFAELRATIDGDDVMITIVPRGGRASTRHLPLAPETIFRQSIARHLVAKLANVDGEVIESCTDGIVAEFANLLPER